MTYLCKYVSRKLNFISVHESKCTYNISCFISFLKNFSKTYFYIFVLRNQQFKINNQKQIARKCRERCDMLTHDKAWNPYSFIKLPTGLVSTIDFFYG
jgi:hypothetical protein